MAIAALEHHPSEAWGPDGVQALDLAVREEVGERLRGLLGLGGDMA